MTLGHIVAWTHRSPLHAEFLMKQLYLYAPTGQLNEATTHYVKTISLAASELGLKVTHVDRVANIPNRANVLVIESKSAFVLFARRPQVKIWLWMQGLVPEEARWQLGSRLREWMHNAFEAIALRRARGVLMVSEAMRKHFTRKYRELHAPVFIMPCANASIDARSFAIASKYEKPNFVYAGSLHTWQCFDLTLEVFRCFQEIHPEARLSVLTGNKPAAEQAVAAAGLTGVDIDFVELDRLPARLSQYKYGFVLRQIHIVNEVATPTKVSSYMAAGVIPIMTNAVHDFNEKLNGTKPVVMADATSTARSIALAISDIEKTKIDHTDVLRNYTSLFENYFEHKIYIPSLVSFLRMTGMGDH